MRKVERVEKRGGRLIGMRLQMSEAEAKMLQGFGYRFRRCSDVVTVWNETIAGDNDLTAFRSDLAYVVQTCEAAR